MIKLCKAFSFVMTRTKVFWKLGMDGHEDIKKHFKLDDDNLGVLCPGEIFPKDYLNMTKPSQENKDWTFRFDESCPSWWRASHEKKAWSACLSWYEKILPLVNWKEARKPVHPFKLKIVKKVSIKQKFLLKKWGSVWDSVGDSVWDSVWGYIGSLFYLKRTQWKYTNNIKTKSYPFQPVVDLWKQGLVPSFDGTFWRLHSGKKAEVVFKIRATKLKKLKVK